MRNHDRSNFATMAGTAIDRSSKDTAAAGRVSPQRYNPEYSSLAWALRTSRSCRRARLRRTAVPAVRPMAKATRGPPSEGSATMTHHTAPLRTRVPSRRSRVNSSRLRRRWIKLTAAYGPSGDEPSELHARRALTCGLGNHVWPTGASDWVDTYVSQQTPQFLDQSTHRIWMRNTRSSTHFSTRSSFGPSGSRDDDVHEEAGYGCRADQGNPD